MMSQVRPFHYNFAVRTLKTKSSSTVCSQMGLNNSLQALIATFDGVVVACSALKLYFAIAGTFVLFGIIKAKNNLA